MCCGQRQKVDRQGNKVTRPKGVALGGRGVGRVCWGTTFESAGPKSCIYVPIINGINDASLH